jgi:hypothetical protein
VFASSRHGANEELLVLGHGFSCRMLAGLVHAWLAATQREVIKAGAKAIEVCRVTITDAGALEHKSARRPSSRLREER